MAKFDADKWLAISAMIVSVGTLGALSYQSLLMRESERASKLPYLYISTEANDQRVALKLSNSGIGPAIVDDVKIHYQGRDIAADPFDFFIGLNDDNKKLDMGSDKVQHGRLIPAGTTILMIEFPSAPGGGLRVSELGQLLKLFDLAEVPDSWYVRWSSQRQHGVIDITYSSVYGEHWRVRSDRIVPERI